MEKFRSAWLAGLKKYQRILDFCKNFIHLDVPFYFSMKVTMFFDFFAKTT